MKKIIQWYKVIYKVERNNVITCGKDIIKLNVNFWDLVNGRISRNPSFAGCALNEAIKFKKLNLSGPPKVRVAWPSCT